MAAAKPKAKTAKSATKKKPATVTKKVTRSTKSKATKSGSLQRADWLVITWVGSIVIFLALVVKVYVIG